MTNSYLKNQQDQKGEEEEEGEEEECVEILVEKEGKEDETELRTLHLSQRNKSMTPCIKKL